MLLQNDIVSDLGDKVAVLGFPCNQFGFQNNASDAEFLNSLKYVRPGNGFQPNFHVMAKVNVNGASSDPFFKWMRNQIPIPGGAEGDTKGNGVDDNDVIALPRAAFDGITMIPWSPVCRSDISWNFEKFLFDKNGTLIKRYNRWYKTADIHQEIKCMV